MSSSPDPTAEMRAVYLDAVERLPLLSRVVLRMHQADDLPFEEIARRLSIDMTAVMACIAEALGMIVAMLDGERPRRWRAADAARAAARERRLHASMVAAETCSNEAVIAGGDSDSEQESRHSFETVDSGRSSASTGSLTNSEISTGSLDS